MTTRHIKIARVSERTFEAMLSGQVRCVNWPSGSHVQRMMFDASTDDWLMQVVNEQSFSDVPEHERFPELDLLFEKIYP